MWREYQMLRELLEVDKLTWYGVDGPWVWSLDILWQDESPRLLTEMGTRWWLTRTVIRHASPIPGGLRGPCESPQEVAVQTLVFSGEKLHRFFRSVAHSIVQARHIKLKPLRADPEKDSFGVRVIMKIMPDSSLAGRG
jgi:hypothetical protein